MLGAGASVINNCKKIANTDNFSYQDFIKFFFDRPVYHDGKQWFFQPEFEDPTFDFSSPLCNKKLLVKYICEAFQDIEGLAKNFSEYQFYCALQYIIDSHVSPYRHYFFSEDVPLLDRVKAISLMYNVFEKVFQKVCSNNPEPNDLGEISYNRLCWMWWDIFSLMGVNRTDDIRLINQEILDNLDKILSLDNVICKKSALHGLGHLYSDYPEIVEEIIERHEKEIPACLSVYASHAIRGDVR